MAEKRKRYYVVSHPDPDQGFVYRIRDCHREGGHFIATFTDGPLAEHVAALLDRHPKEAGRDYGALDFAVTHR